MSFDDSYVPDSRGHIVRTSDAYSFARLDPAKLLRKDLRDLTDIQSIAYWLHRAAERVEKGVDEADSVGGETVLIELNNLEAFNLSTGLALLAKHFSEHMGLLEREYEEGREVEEEYVVNEYGCEIPRRLAGDDFRPQPPKPAAPTIQQSGNVLDFSAALRARQNCGNPPSAA